MLNRLKQLFVILAGGPTPQAPAPVPATSASPPTITAEPLVLHDDIGIRDATMSGWLRGESGELLAGFRILTADVVLDIGCGEGFFAAFCGEQGAEVILADVDASTVKAAEARVRQTKARAVRALVTDGDPLPLEAHTASKIVLTEVLEHVDDPRRFLAEAVRVGRPGALYLISVPDPVHEHLQKQDIAAPAHFEKPNHIRIFEREQFRSLVTEAGLEIETEASSGFYWAMWWIFFWACKQDLAPPWHPLLTAWTSTWNELLNTQQGPHIKKVLDQFMPKSQIIIARKP